MTTAIATIGHNGAPDPIADAVAPFLNDMHEAANWADGAKVENDGQEAAVDALIKRIKEAKKAVEHAEESDAKPIYDQWKARKAMWKPTLDDLDRVVKALVATVDPFKRAKAAAKEEAARKAREDAILAAELARKAAASVDRSNLDAVREAEAAAAASKQAEYDAKRAAQDGVKGMRTYTVKTITDGTACARWIWANDKDALLAWMQQYVDRASAPIDGVEVTTEKRAV